MDAATREIARRQREIQVGIEALRLMQAHYGNPYFSFRGCSKAEEAKWYAKAELLVTKHSPNRETGQ